MAILYEMVQECIIIIRKMYQEAQPLNVIVANAEWTKTSERDRTHSYELATVRRKIVRDCQQVKRAQIYLMYQRLVTYGHYSIDASLIFIFYVKCPTWS